LELHAISSTFGEICVTGDDLFSALIKFRLILEKDGYLLLCNAARRDAYASRMSREMGGGRMVYVLKSGNQAQGEDMVDALAPATIDKVASVAEQREWYGSWLRSLQR
jgi:hypothetical protein